MTADAHNDAAEPTVDLAVEAWLERGRSAGAPDVSGDWEALQRDLRAEGGVGALRGLKTRRRVGLTFVSSVLIVLAVLFTKPRPDLEVLPTGRMIADLVLLGASLLLVVVAMLHPIHRPPLGRLLRGLCLGLAAGAVSISVSLPAAHLNHPASLQGLGEDFVVRALKCFAFGVSVGAPMVLLTGLLKRSGRGLWRFAPSLLVAAMSVLVGVIGLYLHCPITAPEHLWAGHATVWIPFVIVALLVRRRGADG